MTEILRVGGSPDDKPAYHTLYWNCQDIATRFALVAADNGAAAIQVLANMFDTAKSRAAAFIGPLLQFLISSTTGLPLLKGAYMLREQIRQLTWDYKALQDHCVWETALERQFPELQGLGHGHKVWHERAYRAGTIPKLLGPFLFLVCGEVVT